MGAASIPTKLSPTPLMALINAMLRIRRPMCIHSSTLASDDCRMTAPAASEVMSLLTPSANPTGAAIMARSEEHTS